MTEEIEKILKDAERLMRKAERTKRRLNEFHEGSTGQRQDLMSSAIYLGIQALYKQNKVIIELLKYKNK